MFAFFNRNIKKDLLTFGVPGTTSHDCQMINILKIELQKKKEKLLHMNITIGEISTKYKKSSTNV